MCHSPMKKTKPKQMQCRKNGALIETKVVESIKGHENILTSYLKRKKQGETEDREVLGFEYEYRIVSSRGNRNFWNKNWDIWKNLHLKIRDSIWIFVLNLTSTICSSIDDDR